MSISSHWIFLSCISLNERPLFGKGCADECSMFDECSNRWMFRVHFYHFHFSLFHFHFHWVDEWMRWMALRCDDAGQCREVKKMAYWGWPELAMVAMDSNFGVSNWCLPNMFSKWWLFSSICGRVDELTQLRNWWTVMDGVFFGESDVDLKTT